MIINIFKIDHVGHYIKKRCSKTFFDYRKFAKFVFTSYNYCGSHYKKIFEKMLKLYYLPLKDAPKLDRSTVNNHCHIMPYELYDHIFTYYKSI